MRESPLPGSAGEAGFFGDDGRVVVAIAKCMALCGLRPEAAPSSRLDAELTQVVIEVLAGELSPERPRHSSEYWMLGPLSLVGAPGELLEQRVKCADIALPLSGLSSECLGRSFEAVWPAYHIDRHPPHWSVAHRTRHGTRIELAERESKLITEMANHFLGRHRAPTPFALRRELVEAPAKFFTGAGIEHGRHRVSNKSRVATDKFASRLRLPLLQFQPASPSPAPARTPRRHCPPIQISAP